MAAGYTRGAVIGVFVLLSIIVLTGCGLSQPQGETLADLPSLDQVQSRLPRKWDAPSPEGSGPQAKLHMRQIALPLDRSLDEAWALTNQSILPRGTRAAWQRNGLRLGLLDRSKVARFIDALPSLRGVRRSTFYAAGHPAPLIDSPSLQQPYIVRFALNSDSGGRRKLTGGRMQLLVQARPDATGQLYTTFTPHHYKQQFSVKPRGPLEKQLDGTVFNQLAIRLPDLRGKYIVIGLHRPPPKRPPGTFTPNPPDNPDDSDNPEEEAADPPGMARDARRGTAGSARLTETAARIMKRNRARADRAPSGEKPQTPGKTGDKDGSTDEADKNGATGETSPQGENEPERIKNPLDLPPVFGTALLTGRTFHEPRQLLLIINVSPLR